MPQLIAQAFNGKKYSEALVRCWLYFRDNTSKFNDIEKNVESNDLFFQQAKSKIINSLLQKDNWICPLNPNDTIILSLLTTLDEFIFTKYSAKSFGARKLTIGDKGTFWIVQLRMTSLAKPLHSCKAGHISSFFNRHAILPTTYSDYVISIKSYKHITTHFDKYVKGKGVYAHACQFVDGVKLDWGKTTGRLCEDPVLTNVNKRWQSISGALDETAKKGVQILVFPELAVCEELRNKTSQWLKQNPQNPFFLVLPGSFHDCAGYNSTVLLDRDGNNLISHRKLTRSTIGSIQEGNNTGNSITLLETPIGLVGIPICLDFCEEDQPFNEMWKDLAVEWLLVPAFGPGTSLSAHKRKAESLLRSRNLVFVLANQDPDGLGSHNGFILVPGATKKSSYPDALIPLP